MGLNSSLFANDRNRHIVVEHPALSVLLLNSDLDKVAQ